jgi:protein associated with RNAse G/E
MRYTAGELFKIFKQEGVLKIEKGAILNEESNYLVTTKQGNLFNLTESFFDYYSIDEIFDLCYGVEVHNRFEMYKNKKSKIKSRRSERIMAYGKNN